MEYDFDENKVKTKKFWGQYNFTADFGILIGQDDPLFKQEISRQVAYDNLNLNGFGTSSSDSLPMIALHYKGFSFALAKPVFDDDGWAAAHTRAVNNGYVSSTMTTRIIYDNDTFLPQLQANYAYEADSWRFKVAGAYAHTRIKEFREPATTFYYKDRMTIESWLVGADGQIYFGPLSLGAAVSYGANWELAGWNESAYGWGYPAFREKRHAGGFAGDFRDTYSLMLAFVAGYQLTERLYFEGGVGYRRDDSNGFDKANTTWTAYLQADYEVTQGFHIVPEIGYIDYGKNTGVKWPSQNGRGTARDLGYEWYVGAKWQMDF